MSTGDNKDHKLLRLLAEGPVVGDGGYMWMLEKRGYALAGNWTPEVVLEHPDAVREAHREFARAGSDVLQAFTFYSNDGKINSSRDAKIYKVEDLNRQACQLARSVAEEYGGLLVCGGLSATPTFKTSNRNEDMVKSEFRKQCQIFIECGVDFLLGEYFGNVQEAIWAVEVMKEYSTVVGGAEKPVAITMRIGPSGDEDGNSPQECAIQLAKSGADLLGTNCKFDPNSTLKTMQLIKDALEKQGLLKNVYLMCQPVGIHCPDAENEMAGYNFLPETPFACEHRTINRLDAKNYARRAHNMGIRYIGACCGFESHHVRQLAAELEKERKRPIPGQSKLFRFGPEKGDPLSTQTVKNWAERGDIKHWNEVVKSLKYHVLPQENADEA